MIDCPHRVDGRCRLAEQLTAAETGISLAIVAADDWCGQCRLQTAEPSASHPTNAICQLAVTALSTDHPFERERLLARTRSLRSGRGVEFDELPDVAPGVGSELSKALTQAHFTPRRNCRCAQIKSEMDRLGPDAVEDELDRFSREVVDSYRAAGGVLSALATAPGLRPLTTAIAGRLIRAACGRVRGRERLQIVAVVPLFNPSGYDSRNTNYQRAIAHYQTLGFDRLITVEAVFPGQQSQAVGEALVLEATDCQVLWQKERLINLAIDRLRADPPDAAAWLDADLEWTQPRLHSRICTALQRADVVQLFDRIELLGRDGLVIGHRRAWAAPQIDRSATRVPGFAWAARWDVIASGLWETAILGAGDAYMRDAWLDLKTEPDLQMTAGMHSAWEHWRPRRRPVVGFVPITCRHHWHGQFKRRGYGSRPAILLRHNFDPVSDLRVGGNGLWEWTGANPQLAADVAAYFDTRKEDDP